MNFRPVIPEFNRVKGVHTSRRSAVYLRGSVLSGAITTQFCLTYPLEGVTAMLRGLHAFLVLIQSRVYLLTIENRQTDTHRHRHRDRQTEYVDRPEGLDL